jgi:hypothetical protein
MARQRVPFRPEKTCRQSGSSQKLDGLVLDLGDKAGLCVRFWHVLREWNRPADVLANAALDGEDWKSFGAAQLFAGGPKPYVRPCDDREETAETL